MIIVIAFLGLAVGSFLAAYTYRAPLGIVARRGRSRCPLCKLKISWYDNIPVVSYLFLGGKCRYCGEKISLRYPIIETTTAIVFVLVFLAQNQVLFFTLLASGLIAIVVTDWEHQIILDDVVFFLLGLALVAHIFSGSKLYEFVFAGFAASVFLLVLHIITKGRGMGLGDVKLALPLGTTLGLKLSFIWLFSSFIIGGIVGLLLLFGGAASLKQRIAFGPFLVFGYVVTWLFGQQLSQILL